MTVSRLAGVGIALLALIVSSCRPDPDGDAATSDGETASRPSVVLVSIDTLRSDRLPVYGYDGVETPALDAFRDEAVLFERAYSHYPLTLPSHASILTGVLPAAHGVRNNLGYRLDPEAHRTLATRLRDAGYRTGAAVSSYVVRRGTGLEDGFDHYDDEGVEQRKDAPMSSLVRSGAETVERALAWVADGGDAQPFFLFVHLYEPHAPYEPPPEHAARGADPYDGEVAHSDALVGELMGGLRRLGAWDDALVIVLSDHGEGLGDHGEPEHGIFLYREAIQVPLLVRYPGGRSGGETVRSPTGLVDVVPTVLDVVGLPPEPELPGLSLRDTGALAEPRPIVAETFYPRLRMGWNELRSVVSGDHHFIEAPRAELYDLARDPGETRNVLAEERRTYARLREELEPHRRPLEPPGEIDAEDAARLAALGYAGTPVLAEGPLPDAKDQIHQLADLQEAVGHVHAGEWAEAVPILRGLVEENPLLQEAWEQLGLALHRLGRREEAVAAYRRALENAPATGHVAMSLATLYSELGEPEKAREHARLAGDSPATTEQALGLIALGEGRLDEAEAAARRSLEAEPEREGAVLLLARALSRTGRDDEAAALLRDHLERHPEADAIYDELVALSEELGPPDEVVEAYEALAEATTRDVRRDLARAYFRAGRLGAAREILAEILAESPDDADALETLGAVALGSGRADLAHGYLERAVRLDPERAVAWNSLGVARYQRGDAGGALQAWQRSLELDSTQLDALFNLGLVAADHGRPDVARRALRSFLEQAPAGGSHRADRDRAQSVLQRLG